MKKPKQILWLGLFFFLSWSLQAEQKKLKLNPWYASQTIFASGVAEALMILQTPTMINPRIDQGSTIFSYFSKPTYQLGLPGQHWATMVTPEGWLFNGEADLVFLDQNLNPIKQRLYTLYKGWIPAIQYQLKRRGLIYKVEAFQFWLEGEFKGVPINFIRFSVKNSSSEKKTAGLGVGFRYGTSDHRLSGMRKEKFNPFWKYKFKENYILRDGKLIYYFDQPPSKKWQFKTRAYKKGNFYILEPDRVCAIVQYQFELAPGKERSFTFKFPQSVLNPTPELLAQLSRADFETCLKALKSFWTRKLNEGMTIYLSEPKVVNTSKTSLIHNIMCQEYPTEGEIKQVVNRFQYNRFWLRDSAFHARMYALWGRLSDSKRLLRHFLQYQDKSGNFLSQKGQLDGFGQSLWAFGEYLKISRDKEFARELFPAVNKAIDWFEKTIQQDKYYLMPPTFAMDNEWIIGRYTGHNIWAILGLEGAIEVARLSGDEQSEKRFSALKQSFSENFITLLFQASERNQGRIPPGMDVPDGVDWGNLLVSYPGYILPPDHPLVVRTFNYYREHHYAEGIATYRRSLHHYITERVAQTSLLQGKQKEVLSDFYSILVHTGSCNQGFEWSIFPWTNRDYCLEVPGYSFCNFPPHGWFAVLYNTLLRNMLIREEGNKLHLFSVLSPRWVREGDEIIIKNAHTYFGRVDVFARAEKDRFVIQLQPDFREPPDKIVVHIPFFARVRRVIVDGREKDFYPDRILLSSSARRVEIFWELTPAPEYSYQAFVREYKEEYARRYKARYH